MSERPLVSPVSYCPRYAYFNTSDGMQRFTLYKSERHITRPPDLGPILITPLSYSDWSDCKCGKRTRTRTESHTYWITHHFLLICYYRYQRSELEPVQYERKITTYDQLNRVRNIVTVTEEQTCVSNEVSQAIMAKVPLADTAEIDRCQLENVQNVAEGSSLLLSLPDTLTSQLAGHTAFLNGKPVANQHQIERIPGGNYVYQVLLTHKDKEQTWFQHRFTVKPALEMETLSDSPEGKSRVLIRNHTQHEQSVFLQTEDNDAVQSHVNGELSKKLPPHSETLIEVDFRKKTGFTALGDFLRKPQGISLFAKCGDRLYRQDITLSDTQISQVFSAKSRGKDGCGCEEQSTEMSEEQADSKFLEEVENLVYASSLHLFPAANPEMLDLLREAKIVNSVDLLRARPDQALMAKVGQVNFDLLQAQVRLHQDFPSCSLTDLDQLTRVLKISNSKELQALLSNPKELQSRRELKSEKLSWLLNWNPFS